MVEKIDQIINEIEDLASDFSFDEEVFIELPEDIVKKRKKRKSTEVSRSLNENDKSLVEEFIRTRGITKCPTGFAQGSIDTKVDG